MTGSSNATRTPSSGRWSESSARISCSTMMYQAYFALASITTQARINAIRLRRRSLTTLSPLPRHVRNSSYHTPNAHTNENANRGDFVSEIVENTASGQHRKNRIITRRENHPEAPSGRRPFPAHARAAKPGEAYPRSGCVKSSMTSAISPRSGCVKSMPARRGSHGKLKNRLAVAAQQNAANRNCADDSTTNPTSLESVKYRETEQHGTIQYRQHDVVLIGRYVGFDGHM